MDLSLKNPGPNPGGSFGAVVVPACLVQDFALTARNYLVARRHGLADFRENRRISANLDARNLQRAGEEYKPNSEEIPINKKN